MTMPTWWNERRFGLFVHATPASVPAWAPIGEYAEWYRSHLGDDVADVLLHPRPLVEVLAHHRDRWGHVATYDDFVPLLTFENFDADDWARLAVDAGAGYSVLVTKHHDGWAWWDAPGSQRRLTEHGPCRDIVSEYATACARHGIEFGTYYSLLDWGDDRYPGDDYVDDVLHPQVLDLVERFGSVMLWGDGHWGHGPDRWKTPELLTKVRDAAPQVVVNDRWWASPSDVPDGSPPIVRTFEYDAPDDIVDGPWELTRGVAHSFGHNRAERAEHHMTGVEIVALFTEVVAKGGNLLMNVGPAADGTVPELQAAPLRDAGTWIRRHRALLASATPWTTWGDADARYLAVDSALVAVDISGAGRFAALVLRDVDVHSVERVDSDVDVVWTQDVDGLHIVAVPTGDMFPTGVDDPIGVAVYRIAFAPAVRPGELFTQAAPDPIALAPLLASARPGDIVRLGEGVYEGPATVPTGVTLRGLGADRTTIGPGAISDDPSADRTVLALEQTSRVEHLRVVGTARRSDLFARPVVSIDGDIVTMFGCTVDGIVGVTGDDVLLRAVTAQGILATNADRLHISRCALRGNRWDVGVELRGGGGHHVDSSEFVGHLCAIRISDTTGTTVRGNTISGRWWGVHVDHAEGSHVHGNRISWTMRAVDVDGGTQAVVDGNAVTDGDSGCVVADGASDCEVYGNHWDRCRIGLLAWDAVGLHHQDNVASSLHEPDSALVTGP